MPTATKPKPAAKPRAMDHGPLSVDFAAQLLRERTDLAWVLGIGEPREATEAEKARYEERRLTDPAFGALHALSEQALRGEGVALLPIVAVPAGPAPELDALAAAARAASEAAAFGLPAEDHVPAWAIATARADVMAPYEAQAAEEVAESADPFDESFGPVRRAEPTAAELAEMEAAQAGSRAQVARWTGGTGDDWAFADVPPVTAEMPAADLHTTVIEAVTGDEAA